MNDDLASKVAPNPGHPEIERLRQRLIEAAVAADVDQMEAYMKHRAPFFGVKTPSRRACSKPLISWSRHLDIDEVLTITSDLRTRREREFHYVASDLLAHNAKRLRPADLGAMHGFVTTDAWWDTVDALASPTIGVMVVNHLEVADAMDDWIESDDVWLVRVAIIHQLRFKDRTDVDRLFRYCVRQAAHPDFFVGKAIGWALRQYARTNPVAVRDFVDEYREQLSGLSIREATKHL